MNQVPRGALIGLIGSGLSVYLSLPLFSIPPGTQARLMGLNALAAALAVGVAVVGGLWLQTVDKQQSRVGRAIGWLLVLFPLAYLWVGWYVIALVRGFSFAG